MDRRTFVKTLSALPVSFESLTEGFSGAIPQEISSNNAAPLASAAMVCDSEEIQWIPKVGVVAVGGAGGAVLKNMSKNLPCLNRTIAIDTSASALNRIPADQKILVGGANSRWNGDLQNLRHEANEVKLQIHKAVVGLDIAFIVAGMGGASGTVISPVVGSVLWGTRVASIGAAITPFDFEGKLRKQIALEGLKALEDLTLAVIPISNERLAQRARDDGLLPYKVDRAMAGSQSVNRNINNCPTLECTEEIHEYFVPDSYLSSLATRTFEQLYLGTVAPIGKPGLVTLDPESITDLYGFSALGYGAASGPNAAEMAVHAAIAHPMLGECLLRSAKCVWVCIDGPSKDFMKLRDVNYILRAIQNAIGDTDHEQLITFGATYNDNFSGEYRVTILAGGVFAEDAMGVL